MFYVMKEISSPLFTYIDRFPNWALDREDKKKARKGNIVSFNHNSLASWKSKYNGDYLLFPKTITLDTEITILNPSPIFKKTSVLHYSCVALTIKSLFKTVYCPVSSDFFKGLYLHSDRYMASQDKTVVSGKFIVEKGLLYLDYPS